MGLLSTVRSGLEGDKAIEKIFAKYGLDIDNYDNKKMREENAKNLKQIAQDLLGKGFLKAGMALSFASADKQATVGYLSAIFNQNWILIRQNEIIIRLLEKNKA